MPILDWHSHCLVAFDVAEQMTFLTGLLHEKNFILSLNNASADLAASLHIIKCAGGWSLDR